MKTIETDGITILIDSKQFESLKNLRAGQIKNPHFAGKTELQNTITKVNSSLYPGRELYVAEAWGDIRVKAFQCISNVDAKPQSGHRVYFQNSDEAVLYHHVIRTVLEHGLSITDSIQNTTITKEEKMKKVRMTLVENVEILSNVAQKTIGYTFIFQSKQYSITIDELKTLKGDKFFWTIVGEEFNPVVGGQLTSGGGEFPSLSIQPFVGVEFTQNMPKMACATGVSRAALVGWVQAFNKFMDDIDALNIENVGVPTFKNIVLV